MRRQRSGEGSYDDSTAAWGPSHARLTCASRLAAHSGAGCEKEWVSCSTSPAMPTTAWTVAVGSAYELAVTV
eukprot:574098-Prymnesium_polylepis.1